MMTHDKKLEFIHKMSKLALEHVPHYDSGGTVLGGPSNGAVNSTASNPNGGLVGSINQGLGLNNNFTAGSANIQAGTNQNQLNNSYNGVQTGLSNQQNLVNQTSVGTNQGLQAQGALSNQLSQEANGQGPNPAQAALNQSTGQNIQQQAALMAGQRGAGSNAGLLATQAAQQGASTEQQAVGQAATLQAQQQLAAQQAQQNLAAQQVSQGANAIQSNSQQQQNEQNILQGANTAYNNAAVGMQSNINNVNSQTAIANQNAASNTFGGILSGASSAFNLFAHGGLVKMDRGGNVLDANARKHIAPSNFALPGGRYPIHDISHARNALARVSQYGTPEEQSKVRSAVHKKYPSLGEKKMAKGGEVKNEQKASHSLESNKKQQMPAPVQDMPQPQMMARGGMMSPVSHGYMKMASGGYLGPQPLLVNQQQAPQSFAGQWINSSVNPGQGPQIQSTPNAPQNEIDLSDSGSELGSAIKKYQSGGGKSNPDVYQNNAQGALLNNQSLDPDAQSQPTYGLGLNDQDSGPQAPSYGLGLNTQLEAEGGDVKAGSPSQKAVVKGDSLKNDKIPTKLSEGEVVMDLDTLADPGPVGKMARAVAAHIEARNKGKKK